MQAVRKYVNPVGYQELADRPRDRWLNIYEWINLSAWAVVPMSEKHIWNVAKFIKKRKS